MNKIGIITLPFGPNYGYVLQAYAMTQIFSNKDTQAILLRRYWNQQNAGSFQYKFKRWIYYNVICRRIFSFYDKIPHSPILRSSQALSDFCRTDQIDCIVIGSDQVWRIENVRGANLDFFGGFLDDDSININSFAASFGTNNWKGTDQETAAISEHLKKFKVISVREDSGIGLLDREFNITAKVALDPTLMLDEDDYNKIIKNNPETNNTLATYILDNSPEKLSEIKRISKNFGLRIKSLYNKHIYCSVENWLKTIRDAKYVVVDSFHGMVFSIIFKKQFVVFVNQKRGETRFVSLLSKLNLTDRLAYNTKDAYDILKKPIDYIGVYNLLNKAREESNNIVQQINNQIR